MFEFAVIHKCDFCDCIFDQEPEVFALGQPVRVQVQDGWRLIGIDGDHKHINKLMCPGTHKEIDIHGIVRAAPEAAPKTH